jgi:hypothetical protein
MLASLLVKIVAVSVSMPSDSERSMARSRRKVPRPFPW